MVLREQLRLVTSKDAIGSFSIHGHWLGRSLLYSETNQVYQSVVLTVHDNCPFLFLRLKMVGQNVRKVLKQIGKQLYLSKVATTSTIQENAQLSLQA